MIHPSACHVAVGGGKGGVGKSLVASNLAVALAATGVRVVLVDADLGAANQHTLFGITNPGGGLHAFLEHEAARLEDVLVPTGVERLALLPGHGTVSGGANIPHAQKLKLLRHIRGIDAEFVVIDVGAGVSFNVLDFFDMGALKLTVMTPQLTSIQNAYAFLKGAVLRWFRREADGPEETKLLEGSVGRRETEPVREILARLEGGSPAFAARLRQGLTRFGARIVGNQLANPKDVGVFHAVSRMVEDFLGISAPPLGFVPASEWLHQSVNERRPLMVSSPQDDASQVFVKMARKLIADARADAPAEPVGAAAAADRPPPPASDPLPRDLEAYMRRHNRYPVEWSARLEAVGRAIAVRVLDVSHGGAVLGTAEPLAIGDRLMLTVEALPGTPRLPVEVRNARGGHVGVAFLVPGPIPAQLVAAAGGGSGVRPAPPR